MGDKKRLIFLVAIVVVVGVAAYAWYPRLLPKKSVMQAPKVVQAPPTLIEVPPQKPAPPTPPPVKTEPPPPRVTSAPASPRRYALEFPPFATIGEADEHERRLKEAGLPTLRTTTYTDDGVYTLIVGPFPSTVKASEVMTELRAKPGGVSSPQEAEGGFVFRDGPYSLREVVQRAQEIKGKGYGVRIVPGEGKAPLYMIQTVARLDRTQATKLSDHYRKLGFPNRVITGG